MNAHLNRPSLYQAGWLRTKLEFGDDPRRTVLDFARSLGEPLADGAGAPVVTDIRPVDGRDPNSFQGSGDFMPHTDHSWKPDPSVPRYVILAVLRPDLDGGGETLITDCERCLQELDPSDREALRSTPVTHRSHRDGARLTSHTAPILSADTNGLRVRFRRDLLEGAVPSAALRFAAVADAITVAMMLERGDVLVVDNHRMLHGRRRFRSANRHLLRVHVHEN